MDKKHYFKIKKKLDHFNVDVEFGFDQGILVIQGESGAGKSTILNCISGLMTPEEGEIRLGESLMFDSRAKVNLPVRQRNMGYLFQNYALFPNMTVEANVNYGIKNKVEYKDTRRRKELLAYSEYIMKTFGISHLKGKHPRNISGGEKQRVALSRAIVTKPGLLLLDEPFSALDAGTKVVVYEEFKAFKERFQIPTILITHDGEESRMFGDARIEIKDGKIAG